MADEEKRDSNLDRLASEPELSLMAELLEFLKYNKKWWLLPILLLFGLVGILAALASTGAAPFIYTMF